MTDIIRRHLKIHGIVQGVYFRQSTRKQAQKLGLTGWISNQPDGTVEAIIEGPSRAVETLISWAHRGPEEAQVSSVGVQALTGSAEYPDFRIL